jgi:hypothetical protein
VHARQCPCARAGRALLTGRVLRSGHAHLTHAARAAACSQCCCAAARARYGPEQGYLSFRQCLAQFLSKSTGHSVDADELLITAGVSHGLDLVCRHLARPGEAILVEQPTYFLAGTILRGAGLVSWAGSWCSAVWWAQALATRVSAAAALVAIQRCTTCRCLCLCPLGLTALTLMRCSSCWSAQAHLGGCGAHSRGAHEHPHCIRHSNQHAGRR